MYGVTPAGREASVSFTVNATGQEGPLQIIGLRPPGSKPLHGEIGMHIRNTSEKATLDYWVKPLVVARDRAGKIWDHTNAHAAIYPGHGVIPAGGDVWNDELSTLRFGLLDLVLKELHSTCLRITPVVMWVHFADGTKWELNGSQLGDAFDRANRVDKDPPCPDSPDAEKDLAQLGDNVQLMGRGTDHDHSLYRTVDSNEVESFSFSCSLHRLDEWRVALACGR